MELYICEQCGKEHDGTFSKRFCCRSCISKYGAKIYIEKHPPKGPQIELRLCEKCGKPFEVDLRKRDQRKKRFCSRSCANGHIVTEKQKEKTRKSIRKYLDSIGIIPKGQRIYNHKCIICGKEFYNNHKRTKTCCQQCSNELVRRTMIKHKAGGYRPGSGRSKMGWYKGIQCGSTYELVYVIYNLDHNIKFKRCEKEFKYQYKGKEFTYHPDFELEDETIIEIKGYHNALVDIKAQSVINAGYQYKILYDKDLKYCFDYVIKHYNVSKDKILMLYDESNGYITKICPVCGKEFKTRPGRNERRVCSRTCNGKLKVGNQVNGKHMVNDITKEHKIAGPELQKELLAKGWRYGSTFK